MIRKIFSLLALTIALPLAAAPPPIAIPNARVPVEGLLTGGQPSREQLEQAAAAGYRTVIDLRLPTEEGVLPDEASIVAGLGMRYVHLPITGPEDLTQENVRRLDAELSREGAAPVLFHCASGNRVGALVALRAAWIDKVPAKDALELGKTAGLTRLEPATRERLGLAPADAP